MLCFIALLAFTSFRLAATSNLEKRAELKILRPRSGDIIIADDSKYTFNITWTNNTFEYDASISLRQGPPNALEQVAVLNASTLNNGSYLWSGRDDDWLSGFGTTDPSSGCNYSIELNAGGERVLSEYFTVLNEIDGGLDTKVECPSGAPNITDTNSRTGMKNDSKDGNSTSDADENSTDGNSTEGDSTEGDSTRVSSTILLGATIAGVACFFIILFAVVFCIGKKKGWIVIGTNRRKVGPGYQPTYNTEAEFKSIGSPASYSNPPTTPQYLGSKSPSSVQQSYIGAGDEEMNEYMRLHQKYGDSHMVMGNQLHQMPGNRDGS